MSNYYQILGIGPQADQASIKASFKKLALMYHPDRNPDNPQAEEKFKLINEAYSVLSDPSKRFFYDQQRQNPSLQRPRNTPGRPPSPPPPTAPFTPYENTYDPANYVSDRMKRRINWMILGFAIMMLLGSWGVYRYMNYLSALQYFHKAQELMEAKRYLLAVNQLNQAMAKDSRIPEVYILRGDINRKHLYNYYDASEDYLWVLNNKEQETGSTFNRLGLCYLKMYEPEDALKSFEQAVRLSPDSGAFFYYYGEALDMAGAARDEVCGKWKQAQELGFFLPEPANRKKCVE